MRTTVTDLDRHMRFLETQAARLRKSYPGIKWAADASDHFDEIRELLRQARADIQMTGIGGRRLE